MLGRLSIVLLLFVLPIGQASAGQEKKPAPPPSRYGYALRLDPATIPKGVKVREVKDDLGTRFFISNPTEAPLIIQERYQEKTLVSGTKLVSGKVYQYFPNGVPMEGKTHLKGWQAPFGDIEETLLYLAREPAQIAEGRRAGLSKELPAPESVAIPANYNGKPHEIRATVTFHLNDAYDKFHQPEK